MLDIILEAMKYIIIMLGFALAVIETYLYFKFYKTLAKFLFATIGLYWGLYYLYSVARPWLGYSYIAHQHFVRPGILFTLAVLFGNAAAKYRGLKNV